MPTLAQTGRSVDKLLDSRQKARFRQLVHAEKLLVAKMVLELKATLSEDADGRITSKKGFVSLAKAIDAIFDTVEQEELADMGRSVVTDMADVLDLSSERYSKLKLPKGGSYPDIKKAVDAAMRKRLGIDDKGIQDKGYLGQLVKSAGARDELKKMVAKAVAAGKPMRQLEKELSVKIAGTRKTAGILERHLGGFVLDAYQVADAITNNEFAKRLDLKYFVYSGGLIETSRQFCKKRNNKVFAVWETADWVNDPTLPKSNAEDDSGVITDYNPLEDRGRWRCRHRLLYIPQEEAYRLRPELIEIERLKFAA